eukprot:Sspe_Gene.43339::Locus_21113_Transcript_2_2_Confidence_0.800_Length_1331::g.43339::m.43339
MFAPGVDALRNEGAYKVLGKAQDLERQGKNIVHLEIGQPDLPTPDHIKKAGCDAITAGRTTYTDPQGLLELRVALVDHLKATKGIQVTPANIVVGPGAKPALLFLCQALLQPGDELVYPDPGFPQYPALASITGATPVPVGMGTAEEVEKALGSGKVKMVIINSPCNPTGEVLDHAVLQRIVELCAAKGVWLVSDEIYSSLIYDGTYVCPLALPGVNKERTVLVDGFSKTYCMTGWRLGYSVMPVALAEKVKLMNVHGVGCTASFTQYAGIAAVAGDQGCVQSMVAEYKKRRDFVVEELNKIPGVKCPSPAGAFYVFPDVRAFGLPAADLADRLLHEGGVATLPGTDFGRRGEGHIRLSYVVGIDTLREGISRMRRVLTNLQADGSSKQ